MCALSITYPYVSVCRMRKRSGVGSRQTFRLQWWLPMTSRWRPSRSCVHSGGSCRKSRIAAQNFPQTSRRCRESGTKSTILLLFPPPLSNSTNPSGSPPFWLQSLCLWAQCGYEVAARVLPYPIIKTLMLVSFELPGRSGMITMGRKCRPGYMSGQHHSVHVLVFKEKKWRVVACGIWQTRGTSAVSCSISLSVFLSFELLPPLSSSYTLTTGLHSHTHYSNLEPCMSQVLIIIIIIRQCRCGDKPVHHKDTILIIVSLCYTFKYILRIVYITYSTPLCRAFQDVFWCCCTGAMRLCDGYIYRACCIGLCVTALYIHVFECANAVVFLRLLSPFTVTTGKIIPLANVKHFCL